MSELIFAAAISAFRVLELPVSATDGEIVQRETELGGKDPSRADQYRNAREQLLIRRRDRLRHELIEIPGAIYGGKDFEKFCKKFERNPVDLARFTQNSNLPTVTDIDWKAFLHLAIEERISASTADLTPAIQQLPFPPGTAHLPYIYMTSSLDKFYDMIEPVPEPKPAAEPAPPGPSAESDALARIAVALYHWQRSAPEMEAKLEAAHEEETASRLRVAREEMADALNEGGIAMDDPQGKTLAEVIEFVSVIGWRQQPGVVGEVVSQVIEPIIRRRGAVLRRGKVVMAKAPPPGDPPPADTLSKESLSTSEPSKI